MHKRPPRLVGFASAKSRSLCGFSLIEVTLAIGIIAFAFVSLLALLPAGLTTFRNAVDTGNESRIVQSFVSKVLATDFENVQATLDFGASKEIFYFDEEGSEVDSSVKPIASRKTARIYEAKLFVEPPVVPTTVAAGSFQYAVNVVVVFANMSSPAAKQFDENTASLASLRSYLTKTGGRTDLKIRPVLVSKMDGK